MQATTALCIPRVAVANREQQILDVARGKKILHLGCSDFPFTRQPGEKLLHRRLAERTERGNLWGIDISDEGIAILEEMDFDHVFAGNAERLQAGLREQHFDLITAG